MMKKKVLGIILCLAVCLGAMPALSGCGSSKGISIMFLANASEIKFYESHFAQVEEELGVDIRFTGIDSANYSDKLMTEINGGTTPDIFYIRPSDMRLMAGLNIISSIEEDVAAQTEVDLTKIYDRALSSYRYDASTKRTGSGELYAVPKDLSVQQLGYNKTLIEPHKAEIIAAGISKMPWEMDWTKENYTWDQYLTMAKICNDTSDIQNPVYGSDLPNIEILTWSFGGSLLSDDLKTVTVNTDAVKKAVDYQARLIKENAANPAGATYDNFIAGKVAFYGETNSFNIKDFDENFSSHNMEWDVMPWPVAEGAAATSWTGKITSAGFAISSACKQHDTAFKILMTLVSERTQERLVATEKLALPMYKDVAEQAYVSEDYDDVYSPKSRSVYIDVISGRNGKFSAEYSTYDLLWMEPLDNYISTIFASEPNTVEGKILDAAGYAKLQSDMQTLLNENKDN